MKKFLLSALLLSQVAGMAIANEHTLKFDGDNDLYEWARQTTTDVNALEFVPEFSFKEAGIDVSIKNAAETGKGFALVNAGGTDAGILVYSGIANDSYMDPVVTLTVPGGKITSAKLYLSGSQKGAGLISLRVFFNDEEMDGERDGSLFHWVWNNEEGAETLAIKWENRYYTRYIHSIEVTYTEDLGGKQECGLKFNEQSATAFLGEAFTSPTLENPNGLSLTWSSSDESVATVDKDGKVTTVGAGKTVITVATEGNDAYAAGNTSYTLQVIPVATNLKEMLTFAPNVYDQVKVNFPLTVTYAKGNYAFVLDAEGNAGDICNIKNINSSSLTVTTIYHKGDVIPAGWLATNATMYESVIWEGIPDDVVDKVEVTYPVVTSVTPADADRVVVLKQVTFAMPTASGNTKAYGTTPDGTRYEFQDTYGAATYPEGTYDVTCVVRYSKRGSTEYFYLAPLAYTVSSSVSIEMIETENATPRYYNLDGTEVANPHNNIYIKVSDGKARKVVVK